MTEIRFSDSLAYQFVKEVAQSSWGSDLPTSFKDDFLSVSVNHSVLGHLLNRIAAHEPSALPYPHDQLCYWFVLGETGESLDKAMMHLRSFIAPTYANFVDSSANPQKRKFQAERGSFQQPAEQVYRDGYYLLSSPIGSMEKVFEGLSLWMDLERRRPTKTRKTRPSYFDLHQEFMEAVEGKQWEKAEAALEQIRRLSLSTADNIAFLRLQLWGAQGAWQRIWEQPDYEDLSRLRMPGAIRAILLKTFYWAVIQPREQKYSINEILQAYDDFRSRLGNLLHGRFGQQDAQVLKVFGYLAVKEQNRILLENLIEESSEPQVKQFLNGLGTYLPALEAEPEAVADWRENARLAILRSDYDSALAAAQQVADPVDRAFLFMQITMHSGDISTETVELTLQAIENLTDEQQTELNARYPQSGLYVRFLENTVNQQEFPSLWDPETAQLRDRAWKAISELELRLRRLINAKYSQLLGRHWLKEVDPYLQEKWQRMYQSDENEEKAASLLDYSYLSDLAKLIQRRWRQFSEVFGNRQEDRDHLREALDKIMLVRNSLAHNRFAQKEAMDYTIAESLRLIHLIER